jgi:uncharacterized membrane protein YoaK (UPF0700 family)
MPWVDLINLALPVLLLVVGYFVGRVLERRHYASIRRRERELRSVVAITTRFVPEGVTAHRATLVCGGVVVSSDY